MSFFVPRAGQKSITISEAMYAEVERLVQANPELFDSASQFIKNAIAAFIVSVRAGKK